MKKILAMLLLVLSLSLASCRQGGDVIALVDNPDTTIAADLGLENITVSLNSSIDTTTGNYVDIKVSNNLVDSLVVRNINFDEILAGDHKKLYVANVNALTFVQSISAEYKSLIEAELNNDTYGITAEKLGLSVELSKLSFQSKLSFDKAKELYNNNEDNIHCSVIYLPIKALIFSDAQKVLDIYVLVPVYYEFVIFENSVHSNTLFDAYDTLNHNVNSENVFVTAE